MCAIFIFTQKSLSIYSYKYFVYRNTLYTNTLHKLTLSVHSLWIHKCSSPGSCLTWENLYKSNYLKIFSCLAWKWMNEIKWIKKVSFVQSRSCELWYWSNHYFLSFSSFPSQALEIFLKKTMLPNKVVFICCLFG